MKKLEKEIWRMVELGCDFSETKQCLEMKLKRPLTTEEMLLVWEIAPH